MKKGNYHTTYPPNWPAISLDIREKRAHGRCEWCGVRAGDHYISGAVVVLCVAHLGVPYPDGRPGDKHDKSDCRPENLAALCQRCHLNFDRADHLARAAGTRERKRRERDAARGWVQLSLI
jgi:5-methylcytosine-specific restriction endonuclease McrA